MHANEEVRAKLSAAAKALARLKRSMLEAKKANVADLERDDFLWHYLLQSFAVMGGASGMAGLIHDKAIYQKITFEALDAEIPRDRLAHAKAVCTEAKVRYAKRKAKFIVGCHDMVRRLGGPQRAKEQLLQQVGRDNKIQFLMAFPGIGDKNARNIMMSVYHPDFRDAISVDSRIKAISKQWGLSFKTYGEHESFYLDVACAAGLNGWELDRLMFDFQGVFYPPIDIEDRPGEQL